MILRGIDFSPWVSKQHPGVIQGYDCGDSAQRTGSFYTLAAVLEDRVKWQRQWLEVANKFEKDGILLRGLDEGSWPQTSPLNCSRDQSINFATACLMMGDYSRLDRIFLAWKKRNYFGQNIYANWAHAYGVHPNQVKDGYPIHEEKDRKIPDLMTPSLWRVLNTPYSNSFNLYVADLALLFDVNNAKNSWDGWVQLLPTVICLSMNRPTSASKKALEKTFYKSEEIDSQLKEYFKEIPGGNGVPMMRDLYMAALTKAFGKLA